MVVIEGFYFYITVQEALKLLEQTSSVEIKTYQRPNKFCRNKDIPTSKIHDEGIRL
jgi:hypothetical protein